MQNDKGDIKSNKVLPELVCHQCLPVDQMTAFFDTGGDVEERQKGNQEWVDAVVLRNQDLVYMRGTTSPQRSENWGAEVASHGLSQRGSSGLVHLYSVSRQTYLQLIRVLYIPLVWENRATPLCRKGRRLWETPAGFPRLRIKHERQIDFTEELQD